MGKICWINGQPYSVGLPTGGKNRGDHNNQWDKMIDFLGEDCDNIFHWRQNYSWCQNRMDFTTSYRAYRGFTSARRWSGYYATRSAPYLGFRPILIPLTADTLEPDPSLLEEILDGQKIALASLYLDEKPVDLSENNGPNYRHGVKIVLGDRDKDTKNWLYVIKYNDLLWADRNILVDISWQELQRQGYTD